MSSFSTKLDRIAGEGDEGLYSSSEVISDWIDNWDFNGADVKTYTHRLHNYPAIFIPQLVRKILKEYSNEESTVLDIFNGSGTTTLEAMLCKRRSIGIELNPLAVLLARVKVTPIKQDRLGAALRAIEKMYKDPSFSFEVRTYKNIDFWYSETSIVQLSKLIAAVNAIEETTTREFFLISVSRILREVSYCKHSGFKMHRDKVKLEKPAPTDNQLWSQFAQKANYNMEAMQRLDDRLKLFSHAGVYTPKIIHSSATEVQPEIGKQTVDLILTSPPYGDSRTTVAYGQFSRLSSQWLGLDTDEEVIRLDSNLLGGRTKGIEISDNVVGKSITLNSSVMAFQHLIATSKDADTKKKNVNRLKDVISFYADLDRSIQVGSDYLKVGGYFVLVTASRVVKGIRLNTDQILTELSVAYGFEPKAILFRNIVNKRMPRSVSATNIRGEVSPTMTTENIIILKKK